MKVMKKIRYRILTLAMAILMIPNTVFAQVDLSGTSKIIQNKDWESMKESRAYSSFDDSNALIVDKTYGFKLQTTEDTYNTAIKGIDTTAPDDDYNGGNLNLPDWMRGEYIWFATDQNTAGNIQIKIGNLEIYQCNEDGSGGYWQKVDLVRTITKIEKDNDYGEGYIALGTGLTDTAYIGVKEVKTVNTFYKAGTNTKISLKSNITLKDIDTHQYIGIKADKVSGQYVSKNTKLSYAEEEGAYIYYADFNDNYNGEDFTCAAFIFEGSTFEYTFGRSGSATRQEQYVGSGQNMVKFEPATPNKTVSDTDEEKVLNNTARDLTQSWTYNVEQPIASNIPEAHRYSHFEFQDQIEECMKILNVKVIASTGTTEKDASSWFDISTDNNMVVATLKDPKGNSNFYKYGVYTLKIEVKMNIPDNLTEKQAEELKEKWISHEHYNSSKTTIIEYNKATTVIDESIQQTNDVSTVIHLSTYGDDLPGLKITKDVNRYEHQVGEIAKYTVKVSNTNKNADTAYFFIKDISLPESMKLDFSSVTVSGIDKDNYTLEKSGNGWILKSNGDYALPYGEVITITYNAEALKSGNGTLADNTAYTGALGIAEKQDDAQVYINSPKLDVVKTAPDKKYKVGDEVNYTVTITNINPGTFMRNVVFKDLIKSKGIEIKEGTVAVVADGINITDKTNITYSDDKTSFEISTSYNLKNGTIPCAAISPYNSIQNWADKIVVTYTATVTDKAFENKLENVFTAPSTENTNGDLIKEEPDIPSGGDEDIYLIDVLTDVNVYKNAEKKEYKVGDYVNYEISVSLKEENSVAKDIVIEDNLPSGLKLDKDSLKIDGIANYTTKIDGNAIKISIPELKYGEKVTITYRAKVLAGTEGKTLINKATVNGQTVNPNDSEVSVTIKEAPVKQVVKSPKTGDMTPLTTYYVAALLAVMVMVIVVFKKRKIKE